MTTVVKYFNSAFAGAPVLTGQAGSLIALLDACLVDGYGLLSVDTLSVSGEEATLTISAGHAYPLDGVVLVAGATPAELNGEKRVTWRSSTQIKFAAPGVADGNATGAMTCKMAPAGWEKVFSGTNRAVYRASSGNRHYLRVNNANNNAVVNGYETMADVDTGEGPFPTGAQLASPLWKASTTTDATARPWRLFADDRLFYLAARWTPSYWHDLYAFGEVSSFKVGDAFHTVLAAIGTNDTFPRSTRSLCSAQSGGMFLARAHTQLEGSSVAACALGAVVGWSGGMADLGSPTVSNYVGEQGALTFPNAVDNGLLASPGWVKEIGSAHAIRAVLPGYLFMMQHQPSADGAVHANLLGLAGRRVTVQTIGGFFSRSPSGHHHQGAVGFDLTGPWR